jgi:hypothetical protein
MKVEDALYILRVPLLVSHSMHRKAADLVTRRCMLWNSGVAVGDKVVVNGETWKVVGIYQNKLVVVDGTGGLLFMLPSAWKWWLTHQPEKKTKSRKGKST